MAGVWGWRHGVAVRAESDGGGVWRCGWAGGLEWAAAGLAEVCVVLGKGWMFSVGPWQRMPPPEVLVDWRLGTTCTAWLVTEPELFATGAAVLETCACAGAESNSNAAMTRFIG